MAHTRQSRPDSGLGFHVKVLKTFKAVPSSLGSGYGRADVRSVGLEIDQTISKVHGTVLEPSTFGVGIFVYALNIARARAFVARAPQKEQRHQRHNIAKNNPKECCLCLRGQLIEKNAVHPVPYFVSSSLGSGMMW